ASSCAFAKSSCPWAWAISPRARNFFLSRPDLHQLERLLQRVHPLLVGIEFCGGVVQRLPGDNPSACQLLRAIQNPLIVGESGLGFVEIVLRLLDLFRARSVPQLRKISPGIGSGAFGLLITSTELLILQTH